MTWDRHCPTDMSRTFIAPIMWFTRRNAEKCPIWNEKRPIQILNKRSHTLQLQKRRQTKIQHGPSFRGTLTVWRQRKNSKNGSLLKVWSLNAQIQIRRFLRLALKSLDDKCNSCSETDSVDEVKSMYKEPYHCKSLRHFKLKNELSIIAPMTIRDAYTTNKLSSLTLLPRVPPRGQTTKHVTWPISS